MSARISTVDAELINSLENAVATHAGSDGLIDLPELQKALGLQSERFARRIVRAFDRDPSSRIDSRAFLAAVRALVQGSDRERLKFAFRLHDDDDDGAISEAEMLRMLAISSAAKPESQASQGSHASLPQDELARVLFRAADRNRDGRVSFDEFVRAMRKYPQLLQTITQSEAHWIAPQLTASTASTALTTLSYREANLQGAAEPREHAHRRPLRVLDNHRYDLAAIAAWLIANMALFMYGLGSLHLHPQAPVSVAGANWVRLAQAFALCMSFNAALGVLPLMRHMMARLRRTFWGRRVNIDSAIEAHIMLGHVLFGLAWAHGVAVALAYHAGHGRLGIARLVMHTYHGSMGALLLLLFTLSWAATMSASRSTLRFRRFYSTYVMYGLLFALLAVHAPGYLLWACVPLLGLTFERASRHFKRGRQTVVHELTPLRSGVTRLTIERPAAFRLEAGGYLFINLPDIAKHEWHAFTVSSPPEVSDLTVHVRSLGSWTTALRQLATVRQARGDNTPWLAYIDGPHGRSSAQVFHTRNAVLIGAGSGIIPLASVLSSIVARASGNSDAPSAVRKVQFFWLNRDQHSFEWLAAQLTELERIPVNIDIGVHTCLTGGHNSATSTALAIARELNRQEDKREPKVGIRATTHTGHPDWRIVLTAIADQYAPEPVEVFFSGPPGLAAQLNDHCDRIGMRFHEEKF